MSSQRVNLYLELVYGTSVTKSRAQLCAISTPHLLRGALQSVSTIKTTRVAAAWLSVH